MAGRLDPQGFQRTATPIDLFSVPCLRPILFADNVASLSKLRIGLLQCSWKITGFPSYIVCQLISSYLLVTKRINRRFLKSRQLIGNGVIDVLYRYCIFYRPYNGREWSTVLLYPVFTDKVCFEAKLIVIDYRNHMVEVACYLP